MGLFQGLQVCMDPPKKRSASRIAIDINTNLERDKPSALDDIADHQQILDCSQGDDVDTYIQKGNPDESLVLIERPDKYLRQNCVKINRL